MQNEEADDASEGAAGRGTGARASDAKRGSTDAHEQGVGVECTGLERFVAQPASRSGSDSWHLAGLIAIDDIAEFNGRVMIEPGTTFVMGADSRVSFGTSPTTMTALGTNKLPIRFCSANPLKGRWEGVSFGNGLKSDSRASFLSISNAHGRAAALSVTGPIQLNDVSVLDAADVAVTATTFGPGSSRWLVQGAGGDAMVLTAESALSELPEDIRFEHNAGQRIRLDLEAYRAEVTIHKAAVPYVQTKPIDTYGAPLTFEAGVDYRFAHDTLLNIGWNVAEPLLHIDGTATDPVIFQAADEDNAGPWGVAIRSKVNKASSISHLHIVGGGGPKHSPLSIEASITVNELEVKGAASPVIFSVPMQSGSSGVRISESSSYPLQISLETLVGMPAEMDLTGNKTDMVYVLPGNWAEELNGTISNPGVPYLVDGTIQLSGTSELTIAPGVDFAFMQGSGNVFEVGWNSSKVRLIAVGTPTAPIIFRGINGESGSWSGLFIREAVPTGSRLEYVEIRDATLLLRSAISVTHSTFSNSPSYGIVAGKQLAPDYAATNTFKNNAKGDVGAE